MATQREKFVKGCAARNVPERKAARIWDHMEQFAGYGFNKSHSAAYALLAYQTGYLKANYPVYFVAALLTSERANTDKMVHYIGEAREMGIRVLPPDVNQSDTYFTVVGEDVRFGLAALKNVGEGAVDTALAARAAGGPFRSLFDFCERVDMRAVNRRVIESFVKSGSFDSLDPRRSAVFGAIDRAIERGAKHQRDQEQGQSNLFGMLAGSAEEGEAGGLERVREAPAWGEGERLAYEKESLGYFITGHPLERYRDELAQWATATVGRLPDFADREVTVGGIVTALRALKTRKGDRMATFLLEDLEGGVEVLVFPEAYKKAAAHLAEDQVVMVKGKAEVEEEGTVRLLASEVLPLQKAKLAEARSVTIRIPLAAWDRSTGERLRDILDAHRGEVPVTLEMFRPGWYAVSVAPSSEFRVRPDAALLSEVEGLLGAGTLVLARTANGNGANHRL
jgi:DNA polymerase-3 subunit alpha